MSDDQPVTYDTLKGLLEAFNGHDLEAIMDYFADDCGLRQPEALTGILGQV